MYKKIGENGEENERKKTKHTHRELKRMDIGR